MGMDRPSDQTTGPSQPGVMTEGSVTDAISLLTDDHHKVDRLFKRYEELGSGNEDERARLVDEISDELTVHAAIEEEVFYPALRELLAEGDELVDEGLHEHQEVKDNLAELEDLEPGLARFDATVATLVSNVRHHIREEEGEIFPKLLAAIGQPQLVELGRRLMQAKGEELGSIGGAPIVSIAEDDIVVSMFEVAETEPEPELPPRPARRAPEGPRTAKRPTSKRPTRRPAKKSTAKKSVTKRVAAKKSTAKKSAKRSTAKKAPSRKSAAKAATRRSAAAKRIAGARKAAVTRKSRAKKAAVTRKSRAKKAAAARKSTARTRSRSRTSASRSR